MQRWGEESGSGGPGFGLLGAFGAGGFWTAGARSQESEYNDVAPLRWLLYLSAESLARTLFLKPAHEIILQILRLDFGRHLQAVNKDSRGALNLA